MPDPINPQPNQQAPAPASSQAPPAGNPQPDASAALKAEIASLKDQLTATKAQATARESSFNALRQAFINAGVSEEDASVYAVATLTQGSDDPEVPTKATGPNANQPVRRNGVLQPPTNDDISGGDGPDATTLQIAQLKAEIAMLRQGQTRQETRSLEDDFRGVIEQALDKSPDLSAIIKRAGVEDTAQIRQILAEDLSNRTKANLSARRAATGTWDSSWMAEEAEKAAKSLHQRYRTVIGDPSKLGPSETVAEADRLLATKPVDEPKYKPGMSIGDAQTASRTWIQDQVARAIAETQKAQASVV